MGSQPTSFRVRLNAKTPVFKNYLLVGGLSVGKEMGCGGNHCTARLGTELLSLSLHTLQSVLHWTE